MKKRTCATALCSCFFDSDEIIQNPRNVVLPPDRWRKKERSQGCEWKHYIFGPGSIATARWWWRSKTASSPSRYTSSSHFPLGYNRVKRERKLQISLLGTWRDESSDDDEFFFLSFIRSIISWSGIQPRGLTAISRWPVHSIHQITHRKYGHAK